MKLGYKIALGFAIGMVMVTFMGAYTILQIEPSSKKISSVEYDHIIMLKYSLNMLNSYQEAIFYIRGFLASKNQADFDKYSEFMKSVEENLEKTQEHIASKPALKKMEEPIQEIAKLISEYTTAIKNTYVTTMAIKDTAGNSDSEMRKIFTQYNSVILPALRQIAGETPNKYNTNVLANLTGNFMEICALHGNFMNSLWIGSSDLIENSADELSASVKKYITYTKDLRFPSLEKDLQDILSDLLSYKKNIIQIGDIVEESSKQYTYRRKLADDLTAALDSFTDNDFSIISVDIDTVNSQLNNVINITYFVTAIILLISIGAAFFITRSITVPLNRVIHFAQNIANGHLDETLKVTSKDELGQLTNALNIMVGSLKTKIEEAQNQTNTAKHKEEEAAIATKKAEEALQKAETAKRDGMVTAANQLEGVVSIISSASTELAAQIEESEHGAANQATRISETATAMDEMSTTVIEVAKNASQTSDISSQTRQKAIEGADVVRKVVSSIEKVHTQSRDLKADMSILGEHAQSINQIMGVISDIADQTNLLALNAAIEAARAGEAGRGFAVVADEVRKLAEKTMVSTTDVGNAIQSIQESAKKSMAQVDSAVHDIEIATELAARSGNALEEIVAMAESTADQIRAIATASEEQSASTEEINLSIGEINNISRETSKAMDEASQAVSELARQAQVLNTLIVNMKQS